MGGFAPPIPQDDSNWEIRVAVLLSLFFQMVLIFVGPIRKRSSSPVFSFLIWSCYILADWVADLALGLLLNNMGNIGGKSSSSSTIASVTNPDSSPIIFAFWTPFLLLHLGGPDTITAYSIEDNQVWLRHLIGFLFELFSASVIFFCSLNGNPMIPATILMFVVGIIKYGERTYSLYSGSVNGFRESMFGPPEPGPNYARLMTQFDSKEQAGLEVEIVITGTDDEARKGLDALEEGEAMRLVERSRSMEEQAFHFFLIFRRLFANLTLSYKVLKISQAYFLERDELRNSPANAFKIIEMELNFIYDMMYTKGPIAHSKAGLFLRFIASACLVSSLLIFFFHGDKGSFTRFDVAITYALLLGGVGLDTIALAMLISSLRMLVFLEKRRWLTWLARAVRTVCPRPRLRRWSERTSQMNLLSYCLGGNYRAVRTLFWFAQALHHPEIFDFFIIRHCRQGQGPQKGLLKFMFDGVSASAKNLRYKDAREAKNLYYEDMKEACSLRGQKVLKELRDEIVKSLRRYREDDTVVDEMLALLRSSVEREFDESLLLWHIATDMCCYPLEDPTPALTEEATNMRLIGETLSEYMLYLLIKQPEMLPPGNGLSRYRDTCAEAKRFFEGAAAWDPDHNDARRMLLRVNTSKNPALLKGNRSKSVLFDGVALGKLLRELGEDLMWEVVARVWGEMLAYAAGKCRGSTHVRQLSRGGELITIVWFLMAHMGLSDMYEINERDGVAKLIVRGQ